MAACSVCGCSEESSFSKTQFKKGTRARCKSCIENETTSKPAKDESTNLHATEQVDNGNTKSSTFSHNDAAATKSKQSVNASAADDDSTQQQEKKKMSATTTTIDMSPASRGSWTRDTNGELNESDIEDNGVSLDALKQKILGRSINTGYNDEEDEEKALSIHSRRDLEKEAMCAVCQDILLQPVSLICGHNICKECLEYWIAKNPKCPYCRHPIGNDKENGESSTLLGVNRTLQSCLEYLFASKLKDRRTQRSKLSSGENGGKHDRGYEVVQQLKEMPFQYLDSKTRARQSFVLDASHRQMRIALGLELLERSPLQGDRDDPNVSQQEEQVSLSICMLVMEEEEMEEGTPVLLKDEGDEHLVEKSSRFLGSRIELYRKDWSDLELLDQQSFTRGNPFVKLNIENALGTFILQHSESGAQLELQLLKEANKNWDQDKEDDDESEQDDNEEEEEEENDFLVDDSICHICKDGGELLVCDGGDAHGGCARSFHVACINRSEVPEGDWICQECAFKDLKGVGKVGIEGYEIPDEEEEEEFEDLGEHDDSSMPGAARSSPRPASNDESDSDMDQEAQFSPTQEPDWGADDDDNESPVRVRQKGKRKRLQVLEDSDEE